MSAESRVQWLSHASNAIDGTRFRDAGFEARYLLQTLEEDRRAAILCCAVVGLAFLAFIPTDWRLHETSPTFWALLVLRLAYTSGCALMVRQLRRAITPGRLGLLLHVWTAATICAVLLTNATRPAGTVGVLISHLPLLLLFYVSVPLGHRERLLYAWAYSIGFVLIRLVIAHESDATAWTALVIGTLAIHAFGPVVSARAHHMGRQLAAATWEVEDLRNAAYTAAGLSEYRYDLDSDTRLQGHPAPEAFGPVPPLTFDAVLDMVHPDDRPAVVASYAGARNSGADLAVEFRLGRGNAYHWLRSVGVVVGRDRATRGQLVGLTWDITSRKVAELRAEDLSNRLRLAVDAAQLNPFSVDLRSGEHLPGPRDVELFGAELTSLEQFEALVLPEDRPLVSRLRDDAEFADGRVVSVEFRINHPSGELRWISCSALRLVDGHGRPVQLVGVSYDISARLRVELELRAALQLAHQASEAKSAFLATMSHEIRTPLNAVVGFAGLLLESELDETQRFHARLLRTSSQQLLALIDNVLDFSRIEAGEMPLERVGFVPEECLESCLDLVATQAEAKGLCLTLTVHGCGRRAVLGDLTRVRQIAVNLLSNAIKFTDRGAVRCELVVSEREARVWLGLRVTDSGIGMTEEVRASLFQPFRQGDASTTRRYGGTGLGLSICMRLARLMGGEIEATSSPGEGSEFVIALPVAWLDDADATPGASATAGLCVAVAVYPRALQGALTDQLGDFGTRHVVVEPAALATHLAATDGRYDALLIDDSLQPLCDTHSDWPRARNGSPLPAVVLTPLRHDRVMSIGAHGERRLPLSRVLKPSELRSALAGLGRAPTDAGADAGDAQAAPTSASPAWRVLVAEDNSVNRILLQLQLEALGYQADTVASGAAALDALRAAVHDIVLMDIEMPEMDGMEATRLIRAARSGAHAGPYVIAVTAHVMADSRARFLDAGMDDYVSKPVMVDALREALERAHRSLRERRGD